MYIITSEQNNKIQKLQFIQLSAELPIDKRKIAGDIIEGNLFFLGI